LTTKGLNSYVQLQIS